MSPSLVPFIGILAALIGLWASLRIFYQKRKKKKMVCPLRANCDKVLHSTHAHTFGVPNEQLGILYYSLIGCAYALVLLSPHVVNLFAIKYGMLILSLCGVVLSIYFIALQAIVIRAWCTLCLTSAVASIVLGVSLFSIIDAGVVSLLAAQRTLWIIVHSVGFVLGVGAATITDVFFFRFLKDHRISDTEKETLETLTAVIWVGLAMLVVSGIMIFLPEQVRLIGSAKFQLKLIVVGVIIVNGLLLNLYVSPRMRLFSMEATKPARVFRRVAFALGAISICSWYTAFLLGSIRSLGPHSLSRGIIAYGVIIVSAIVMSQIAERQMIRGYRAIASQKGD